MGLMLKTIRPQKVSDQVCEQIREMIYRGEFKPGDRLMPERELATVFNVGRPAVREAIQKLIDHGLVESRRGVGTFILDSYNNHKSNQFIELLNHEKFSILEYLEVRTTLELKSAELAAKRATEVDIGLIERSLAQLIPPNAGKESHIDDDISYHMNIVYASKNILLVHLMKSLYDIQHYSMHKVYSTVKNDSVIDELVYEQHVSILNAIREHNPDLASKAMQDHLTTVTNNSRKCVLRG